MGVSIMALGLPGSQQYRYAVVCLARTNDWTLIHLIGNARIAGLDRDIDLSNTRFNTALTVFHILYIVVNVPSNWLLKYAGGGRYLPLLAASWGVVAACMGTVKSFGALVTCRLLLGGFEGAFFGGMILYMSMFYKRHELMTRVGIFSSAASLSAAFGGLLASGLSQIDYGGYPGWVSPSVLVRLSKPC